MATHQHILTFPLSKTRDALYSDGHPISFDCPLAAITCSKLNREPVARGIQWIRLHRPSKPWSYPTALHNADLSVHLLV